MDGIDLYAADKPLEAIPLLEEQVKHERQPGQATLFLGAVRTLASRDRSHIDDAVKKVRGNVPMDLICSLVGSVLWDIGSRDAGNRMLRESVELNPSWQNLRCCATRFDKDPALEMEAAKYYEMILAMFPDDVDALVGRGCIRVHNNRLSDAMEDFRAAARARPSDGSPYYEMGTVLALEKRFRSAIKQFKRALRRQYWQPDYAHAAIGYCFRELGRLRKAEAAVKKALAIQPDCEYALELLKDIQTAKPCPRRRLMFWRKQAAMDGIDLYAAGKPLEAIPLLEEQVKHEQPPGRATLFLGAARTLVTSDRSHVDEAVGKVHQNVSRDEIACVHGSALWDTGHHAEGGKLLREAVALNPSWENLLCCASRFDRDPTLETEAEECYEMVLAGFPDDVDALVGRGCIRVGKNMLDEALKDFRTAARLEPHNGTAYYEIGNILSLRGEDRAAIREFRRAVRRRYWQPHFAYAAIAYSLHRLGKLRRAEKAAKMSLAMKPGYECAIELLKEIQATRQARKFRIWFWRGKG